MEVSKQDWKLFREKISAWQESYIEKLNHEYVKLLEGDGAPSEKFWALERRIKIDKKHKGVLIEMRKQNMPFDLVDLIRDGVIDCKDLEDFSSELQETVKFLIGSEVYFKLQEAEQELKITKEHYSPEDVLKSLRATIGDKEYNAMMKEAATDKAFISRTSKCDEDFAFADGEYNILNQK